MQLSSDDMSNAPLEKFESMLQTNHVLFFDSEEFEQIIAHYLENGKVGLAKKATKLGLEQHPTSTALKLFQIELYILDNELDTAETLLDELYLLEQSNEEIYIQKAQILSRRENHKKALSLLEKALEIAEDEVEILSMIGMEYLYLEDYENAKLYYMQCLEKDETDYAALYNIVYCFDYLDQHTEAIYFLNDFLNKNPYCEVAWHQVGKQYYQLKDYKKALAAFDFAIISDDTFIGAYLEKGKTLEALKKYQDAVDCYAITLQLDDPTSFALLRIGKCFEKLHNSKMALQFYTQCVEEDPLLDKGWIAVTDFYSKQKNFQKALYYIEKALNIDSENVRYWMRYAKINMRLHLFEEAERGYHMALELGNYEQDTWLSRGDLLIQLGEHKAAIINLKQAAEFYPKSAEIQFRLAGLFFLQSQPTEGDFHLNNALKLEPDFFFILEELFPKVFSQKRIQDKLKAHKNTSL